MKYLEDLRDLHKGEEIWVIGVGSSLDRFPLSFFKDKLCIGANYVFSVFLNIRDGHEKFKARKYYAVCSHREPVDLIVKHRPDFLTSCFLILSPQKKNLWYDYRKYCCKEYFGEDPYWIRNAWQKGNITASDKTFRAMAKCIMAGRNDCRYFCRGTTLHWAIEVAVVLGSKKIYVVGADAKGAYIRKHGSMYRRRKPTRSHPQWTAGTKSLAAAFRPYGVQVVKYVYGKGEIKL